MSLRIIQLSPFWTSWLITRTGFQLLFTKSPVSLVYSQILTVSFLHPINMVWFIFYVIVILKSVLLTTFFILSYLTSKNFYSTMDILTFSLTTALEPFLINYSVCPHEIQTYLTKLFSTFLSLSQVHTLYKSELKLLNYFQPSHTLPCVSSSSQADDC